MRGCIACSSATAWPESVLDRHWYRLTPVSVLLLPLSLLFCALVQLRRWLYRMGVMASVRLPVPVIVIGNITVGGTGKTPLVIWLARYLLQAGYRPGIVTREESPIEQRIEIVAVCERRGAVGPELPLVPGDVVVCRLALLQ